MVMERSRCRGGGVE